MTINGKALPQLDQLNTVVDLAPYVKRGLKSLTVQVASTLYNKVVGTGKAYGLLGTNGAIRIIPYHVVPIAISEAPIAARNL